MDTGMLDRDRLQDLLTHRAQWCVSLFMPTDRIGGEIRQDRIRMKNLLVEAEDGLVQRGMRATEAHAMLAPAWERLDETAFWQGQQDGLALYVAPGFVRELRVPLELEARVACGEQFEVAPLLPLLMDTGHFYVLALSQAQVRLLVCTRASVADVRVPGLPADMEATLAYDDQARPQEAQTPVEEQGAQADERFALFHGQGGDFDGWRKVDILRWFHRVEDALRPVLGTQHAPMVLACVEYLRPLWREANTYPGLLDQGLDGNPDRLDARELRDRAWEIVQPLFQQEIADAKDRFGELSARQRIAVGVGEAVPAARFGRVDTLFVEQGSHVWGRFDAEANRVDVHGEDERQPGDVDLVDLAARDTVLNGGVVYALEKSQMPGSKPIAATLRY
jgi:hypothetical protein